MFNPNYIEKDGPLEPRKREEATGEDFRGDNDNEAEISDDLETEDLAAGHHAADMILKNREEERLANLSAEEWHQEVEKCRAEDAAELKRLYVTPEIKSSSRRPNFKPRQKKEKI